MRKFNALFLALLLPLAACGKKEEKAAKKPTMTDAELFALPYVEKGELPGGVQWLTNDSDPVFASPEAKRGGTFYSYMLSFPLTLRTVGPDSNGAFRSYILDDEVDLLQMHPETGKITPGVATHWASSKDNKTLYLKLNPKAKWSDGVPLTAKDIAFALHFYRSKHIVAPWYNTYYNEKFEKIVVYDDHTLAIVGKERKNMIEMVLYYTISPRPMHFHVLDEKWVQDYNWTPEPKFGPYKVGKVEKGKFVELLRVKDWWGEDMRFFKNRFNVDKIRISVIRDNNIAWEHFKKGKLDGFALVLPDFWHDKSKDPIFEKGFAHKMWFYHDRPQPVYYMTFNQAVPLFKDKNVRLGFSYAMNIEKVLKQVLRGDYSRLESNTMGYGDYDNKNVKARRFNLKKADEHLNKAGWTKRGDDGIRVKDGKRLSARITYGAPHHTDRLVVLKEEAKKAGIELTLQLLDSAASFKAMLEKQHEIAYGGWGAQDRPQYWGQWHSDNANKPQTNNFANLVDPTMDKWIESYRKEFDETVKAKLARKIQQRIYDEAYMVTTWAVPYIRLGHWRWVRFPKDPPLPKRSKDPFSYPSDSDWGGVFWIDEDLKKETKAAMKAGKSFEPVTLIDTRHKR
jgi:microcin C transport system substrate-binding protein